MDRNWIVDAGLDAPVAEKRLERVPAWRANHIQVIDMRRPAADGAGRHDRLHRAQPFVVSARGAAAPLIRGVETRQLDPEDRRLDGVEPRVHSLADVLVFLQLTVAAQLPDARRERFVIRHDDAAVTERAEVLARIEAEGAEVPEAAAGAAVHAGAMGL